MTATISQSCISGPAQAFMEQSVVEKKIYLNPQLLFGETAVSAQLELNFAIVDSDGERKLIAVTSAPFGNEFKEFEGLALEALLIIAQDNTNRSSYRSDRYYGSPISYLLSHPDNLLITEEVFLRYILEQDQYGVPRICTLNADSTLDALKIIKKNNLSVNLNTQTPSGKTLFTLWVGKGKTELIRMLLEIDPSVIQQIKGLVNSPFVESALMGCKSEAELLIDAMTQGSIPLSLQEDWIKKALKNDCSFSDEDFTQLDRMLKNEIFFVSNTFANIEMVAKLKHLGMGEPPLFWPGPSLIARNMDIVTSRSVIENFLKGLRKEGLLLTEDEFADQDQSAYIQKRPQFGRIQGRHFVEKIINEHRLKYIKVPQKKTVIKSGLDALSFTIAANLEITAKEDELTIYAKRISPCDRKISLEEALEFILCVEMLGYNDIKGWSSTSFGDNIMIAEDGIYFIDNEFENFKPLSNFRPPKGVEKFLDPKDVDKYLEEYQKRKKAYEEKKPQRDQMKSTYSLGWQTPYKWLREGYENHEFVFPLSSLFNE